MDANVVAHPLPYAPRGFERRNWQLVREAKKPD
jgi:hypothetical protein